VSRPLLLLGVVYVLIAALVMPGSLLAAEEAPDKAQGDTQGAASSGQQAEGAGEANAEVQRAAGEPPASGSPPSGGAPAEQPAETRSLARAAASGTVVIRDFEFAPRSITVNAGDTVTWANNGPSPHSATANDGSFDTGVFGERRSRSHRFVEAGTFTYYCRPHPFMKGSVTVRGASSGGGGSADSDAKAGASSDAAEGSSAGAGGSDAQGGSQGSDAQGGSQGAGGRKGARLPASGADAGILAGLGLAMLALGTAMRRRTARGGA